MNTAFEAMKFAREVHASQRRKYTGALYAEHLAEVTGIVATVTHRDQGMDAQTMIAVAWLHDSMEDQGITYQELDQKFGAAVAVGVQFLSDMEVGNRATRKAASAARLAQAPAWLQTIKYADLISNTTSIVEYDPNFAVLYLAEKRVLLAGMNKGDPLLYAMAAAKVAGA